MHNSFWFLFKKQMKILIAPASFKGSLSSIEAAKVMRRACLDVLPSSEIVVFPIADGGEGTIDVLKAIAGGRFVTEEIHDPIFRKIKGRWLRKGKTAYVEMAQAAGLTLLKEKERNPLRTTSFGVGEIIRSAISSGCREIFIGAGGSATNDGGIGALTALGTNFFGKGGRRIYPGSGKDLVEIEGIDNTGLMSGIAECRFTILSDVKNTLCGKKGAAYVYAPQKGADRREVEFLDRGLRNYGRMIRNATGIDVVHMPGAGAAGGIAGGFAVFMSAGIVSGIETILKMGRFEGKIRKADLLLTGEGRMDNQTLYGKAPSVLARLCRKYDVPLVILAGNVEKDVCRNQLFEDAVITSIVPGIVTLEEAIRNAGRYLYDATVQVLKPYRTHHSRYCSK